MRKAGVLAPAFCRIRFYGVRPTRGVLSFEVEGVDVEEHRFLRLK